VTVRSAEVAETSAATAAAGLELLAGAATLAASVLAAPDVS
jgi:hypothetical protein